MYYLKKSCLLFFIIIAIFGNITFAEIENKKKPQEIEDYFNKYSEINLNNGQSIVKVLGTLNTSFDGYHKFTSVANGLLEALIDTKVKQGFHGTELFFINVGDYPETIKFTKGRSEFLVDVGENYRGGGVGNMIFQSEEFVCKLGVTTRYHKGVRDDAVRRWDNPVHEIGHWVEVHGNYRNNILNSDDFKKLPGHWQNRGIDEVFTILVTAWFDTQYSYYDMPQNREQFKAKFPDYYRLFQTVFDESVRNIGQYCANEDELKKIDKLNNQQKTEKLDNLYGKYPKSIIAKTGNNVPNVLQKQDSLSKVDYAYVIDDKLCSNLSESSISDNSSVQDCARLCDKDKNCNRFMFNISNQQCRTYINYKNSCESSIVLDPNNTNEFQYQKITSNYKNVSVLNKLTTFEKLKLEDKICSNNKKYLLTLQLDGNLCLYQAGDNNKREYVWCNMTTDYGQNSSTGLVMQRDGNLVLYNNVNTEDGYIWSIFSSPRPISGYTLVLQDDRNLVVYNGFNKEVWSSNTLLGFEQQDNYQFTDCS